MAIANTRTYHAWFNNPASSWVESYTGAPIRIRQRTVGFINLESATPGFFNFDHAERLQAFADQAAIAIDNARLYAEVEELAVTDALTGVFNRRGLFQLGEREVERAQRFKHPLAIVMLDIDHFKKVNDAYGHPNGDRILAALAQCCVKQIRSIDVMARYGGEEFIILLTETETTQAVNLAERLRQVIEKMRVPIESEEGSAALAVQVTVSLGVAGFTPEMTHLKNLIQRADQALYAAKREGRNRVSV
jgi:diguanylate cyclase (GGDEF)-like protein